MLKEIARLFNEETETELTILANDDLEDSRILMFSRNVITNEYGNIDDLFNFEDTLNANIKCGFELISIDPFELHEMVLADNPRYLETREEMFSHLYLYALRNRGSLGDYDSLEELRRIHETLLLANTDKRNGK